MSEEEYFRLKEMQPIIKLEDKDEEIKQLKDQLQQKENIIKELNDKIEDDKMIIEGNWGCIDNLRKDYNLQKNIIKEIREKLIKSKEYQAVKSLGLNSKMSVLIELEEILDKEVN